MEELAKLEAERGNLAYLTENKGVKSSRERIASNEMCTFLILNISSLQLIPVNMIAYRQLYGSVNPAGIIGPAIVAAAVCTGVAVVYCKVKDRRKRKNIKDILKKYGLEKYDEYTLLKRSGARLPIDNLEFIDPILDGEKDLTRIFL